MPLGKKLHKRDFQSIRLRFTYLNMPDRLPPLTALRAFDAAARHMSFAKAAEELGVTPAALSFQIKSLEDHLGAPVFRRLNRAVELTEAGQALAPGLSDGFQTLAAAWRAALRTQEDDALTITAGPAFTAKWLAPRLYAFAQAHPEIELRFSASLKRVDLKRDPVDVAIRYGRAEQDPDLFSEVLAEDWVCPAIAPHMAQKYTSPEDLLTAPLIHDESIAFLDPSPDWSAWFKAVGLEGDTTHGPRFSQGDHAVDAAVSGLGVVLGRRALVVKDIADGRLVMPFPMALRTKASFRFLCLNGNQDRPAIRALRQWIWSEIHSNDHITDGLEIVAVAQAFNSTGA